MQWKLVVTAPKSLLPRRNEFQSPSATFGCLIGLYGEKRAAAPKTLGHTRSTQRLNANIYYGVFVGVGVFVVLTVGVAVAVAAPGT